MSTKSFAAKVIEFLKGGEEAKMARFESKLSKYVAKQISMRTDDIETLRDKVADANEVLEETILGVDLEQVNKTDVVENYVPKYVDKVIAARQVVEALEDKIEELQEEIKELEEVKTLIFQ
jgi:TolA-binding protein